MRIEKTLTNQPSNAQTSAQLRSVELPEFEATEKKVYQNESQVSLASSGLRIEFGRTQISLAEIMQLTVGDVVQLDGPDDGSVELSFNGRRIGKGELKYRDGKLCVQITQLEDNDR